MSIVILFEHGCRDPVGDIHLHDLLHHLVHQNEQIIRNQEKIMSTQPTTTDLDNAVGTVESAVSKLGTDMQSAIQDLEAKISAAPPQTFDPAPEIARLKAVADRLVSLDTAAAAADPGAPAPPAPTPVSSATTIEVGTDAGALTEGQPIPLQGTVTGSASPVPSGAVTITDSTGTVSLTASLDSAGAFTATISSLPAGSYSLSAAYSGDANNEASSGSLSITVSAASA